MPKHEPERTCIVSREVKSPAAMIRFVRAPDGAVVADLRNRLPGRGVWVSAEKASVAEAVRKRLFSRAFKAEAKASAELADEIESALRDDLRQALALANKAGAVITGFSKVEAAIDEKPLAGLIHAAEAAEDGRRKLAGRLRKRLGMAISGFPVIQVLSGDELDVALGRAHVIHAALVAGAGSDGFLMRWRRYRDYVGGASETEQAGSHEGTGDPDDLSFSGSELDE